MSYICINVQQQRGAQAEAASAYPKSPLVCASQGLLINTRVSLSIMIIEKPSKAGPVRRRLKGCMGRKGEAEGREGEADDSEGGGYRVDEGAEETGDVVEAKSSQGMTDSPRRTKVVARATVLRV